MKNIILLLAFTVMANGYSQVKYEFDETSEKRCHAEIKKIGCTTPGEFEDLECVDKNKSKLSTSCHDLHEERKLKK